MSPDSSAKPRASAARANRRGAARLAAVQALYQMDVAGADLRAILAEFEAHRLGSDIEGERAVSPDRAFFRALLTGVVEAQRRLDPRIHRALAADWPLKRLDLTLRAVLRAGAYELAERADVPVRVAISEYVDVAHAFFGDGEEPRIVNAVLDRLGREVRGAELGAGGAP